MGKKKLKWKKKKKEPHMEQQTDSKLGKEYVKAVYYTSPCLFNYILSTL